MAAKDETASPDPALLGILALMAAERAERDPEPEIATELILDAVGLDHRLIAELLRKKPDAVRMKIKRAKAPDKKAKAKRK